MPAQRTERKYAMTRLAAGDYLLPSNDGKIIWRIMRYEDGPSHGLLDMPRDREFWGYWRWTGPTRDFAFVDPDDWDHWSMYGSFCETRTDAIDLALKEPTV